MNPPEVQSLDQILADLNPAFRPQRKLINRQLGQVGQRFDAQRQGLQQQKRESFEDITEDANRRGLVFSGIPSREQAEFTSDVFLPAMADLENQVSTQRFSLQSALNDLAQTQRERALSLREQQRDRLEAFRQQQRELAARRAAQAAERANLAGLFGDQGGSGGGAGGGAGAGEVTDELISSVRSKFGRQLRSIARSDEGRFNRVRDSLRQQAASGNMEAAAKLGLLKDYRQRLNIDTSLRGQSPSVRIGDFVNRTQSNARRRNTSLGRNFMNNISDVGSFLNPFD